MFDLFTSTSSSRLNAKKESKSISKQSSLSAATSSLKDEDAGSESALQRQFFINLSMKNKLHEFSDPFDCRVFCGTWNVCNKRPSSREELSHWIFPSGQEYADIYSVGFQEIVDLNTRNVVMDSSKSDERAKFLYMELQALIESTTGSKYTLILNGNLVGLCLGVFVKSTLLPFVSDARSATVGIGLMGVMGNKGAVTARFKVHDSSLSFVCCHLRAHREEVAGRNLDVKTISERTNYLPVEDSLFNAGIGQKASNVWRTDEFYSSLSIDQHDFIFWLGDMNYRITKSLPTEEVFRMIDANNWRMLLHSDQLSQERKKGTVFNEFIEPDINFMPTYKYQPGTSVYERRPEKKLRAPAWCDRILYKTKEPIDVLLYDSPTIQISDHMPVHSLFKLQGRKVNAAKELDMYKSQLAMADTLENELAPKVELNDRMIVLESLKFQDIPVRWKMTMVNVGKAPASWRLGTDEHAAPPVWLSFYPSAGVLRPGQSMKIWVLIDLNVTTANDVITSELKKFDHIAVIEVINGSHFFCCINGSLSSDSFAPSSLGSPLEPSESALESDEKISSNPPASETSKSLFGLRRTRSNSNASGSDAGSNASSRNSSPMRPVTNSGAHTPTVAHTPVSLSSPRNVDCNSPNLTG